jgi:hypothetical protein
VPTCVDVADIIMMAEPVFSPNYACSFFSIFEDGLLTLLLNTLNAFSNTPSASNSLLMICSRKNPYL